MPSPYLRLLRPRQVTKNFLCFAGVIFGEWFDVRSVALATATFAAFCGVASACYILNDILDRDRDRKHLRKRERPIASGAVSVSSAYVLAAILLSAGLIGGAFLGPQVLGCLLAYTALSVTYSLWLKHAPLVDVCCIGLGFVLRLLAGIYAVGDIPTAWITLCTFFLSVFIGFAKRRAELATAAGEAESGARPALKRYSLPYLDSLMNGAAIMTVMTYALFTAAAPKKPALVVTVPLVYFAVMHYKWLVVVEQQGEEPEFLVLRDWRLLAAAAAWLVTYFVALHTDLLQFR